jgi:hypothetical protein
VAWRAIKASAAKPTACALWACGCCDAILWLWHGIRVKGIGVQRRHSERAIGTLERAIGTLERGLILGDSASMPKAAAAAAAAAATSFHSLL